MYKLSRQCKLCNKNVELLSPTFLKKRPLSHEKGVEIKELSAAYKPHEVGKLQMDENYFFPEIKTTIKPFTLILPPPNITGTLHLGHALTACIQDVLVKCSYTGLPTLAHHHAVSDLFLFYKYFHGLCSEELAYAVSPLAAPLRTTRSATHRHSFTVQLEKPRTSHFLRPFIPRGSRLWNDCFFPFKNPRYTHKMRGIETMWIPGVDHAGIATQVIVEKKLWKERGITRHEMGRESFEKEVWKWKNEKSETIVQQLRRLNVSLNWDKEVFTMDSKRSKSVTDAFIRLFDQGLIYRADHLVNWSCVLQSAISDIEVDHITVDGATDLSVPGYEKPVKFGVLTRFAYKVDSSDEEIVVATTRPETMLGDVAVAVNPKDTRYSNFIGKYLRHPFRKDLIPVIADDFVDPGFGTGAVKITPAHDPTDFDVGKRHNLKPLQLIDEQGFLTELAGDFSGIKRFDARETIISQLVERKLFRGSENHSMIVPFCSRSKDVVEFLIRPQWFLSCSKMAERAVTDVKEGRLNIDPPNFEKIWFQWLENIRDWCISRQLWWGHRIPAYSCYNREFRDKKVWIAAENENVAKIKGSEVLNCKEDEVNCVQDEDVLDTWFSSGLQPFSVFDWPEKTENLQKYYPLSMMETGHDIIFFWVARMVMLGTYITGTLPFDKILLHGIICDAHGRKMSKSLGNVIAPEDVINGYSLEELRSVLEQSYSTGVLSAEELQKATQGQQKMFPKGIPECGADALRFTLLSHNVKSQIINFDVNECYTNRLFCNKIFQATKFTISWIQQIAEVQNPNYFRENEGNVENLAPMDKWILSRLSYMIQTVNNALENFEFHVATSSLKNFLYYEYCDVYLESIKTDLKEKTEHTATKGHCRTLLTCLDLSLRILAPFMPILAQHLHRSLPRIWNVGLDTSFPKVFDLRDELLENNVENVMDVVVCIRRLKKIFNVTYKYNPEVFLLSEYSEVIQEFFQVIKDLSHLHTLHIISEYSFKSEKINLVEDIVGKTNVFLVVPEELKTNLELDVSQMEKKKEKLLKELEKFSKMMSGRGYKEKVTPTAQENHLKKVTVLEEKIARINYIQSLTKQHKQI